LYDVLTDGAGGEYDDFNEANSTRCGYVTPPPPPVAPTAGTPAGAPRCVGYTQVQDYNDGNFGTYAVTIQTNSTACGYVAPAPPPPPPPAPPTYSPCDTIKATITKTTVTDNNYGDTYDAIIVTLSGGQAFSFSGSDMGGYNRAGDPNTDNGQFTVWITPDSVARGSSNFQIPNSITTESTTTSASLYPGESTIFVFGDGAYMHPGLNPTITINYIGSRSYYSGNGFQLITRCYKAFSNKQTINQRGQCPGSYCE